MVDRLPGEAAAKQLGYSILSYAGNYSKAVYVKEGVALAIWKTGTKKLEANLSFVHKMLVIQTVNFSFPHSRFTSLFEKQIFRAKEAMEYYAT